MLKCRRRGFHLCYSVEGGGLIHVIVQKSWFLGQRADDQQGYRILYTI
jgi:hypothetical protein